MAYRFSGRAARTLALGSSTRTIGFTLALLCATTAYTQAAHAQDAAPGTPQPEQIPAKALETPPSTQPTSPGGANAEGQVTNNAGNEIVVTGFRAALANAVNTKLRSDQIVESISAEDIGKLPDNSIAESIARLPGLAAQRVDGRAQVISIRGLSPDFSTTLLNGREQVTTGDNRAVEYDQYPAELMGGVDVYKTPYAGLIGQGLAGTVDLKTIRPLEYGHRALGFNARGEGLSSGRIVNGTKSKGYRVSATYIDQFLDDTLGITLGASHMESPTQIERFNAWGYAQQADGTYLLGGAKPYVESDELNRTGVIATIEWKPSDAFKMTVDGYYSKFKDKQLLRGIELPLAYGSGTVLEPGFTTNSDGLIDSGTYDNVKGVIRNDGNKRNADLFSAGWNGRYSDNGWVIDGDVSYSAVKRKDEFIESYSGTGHGLPNGATDSLGFHTSSTGFAFDPTLDYTDSSQIYLTDPQGWGGYPGSGQEGYLNRPHTKDHLAAFKGSVARDINETGIKTIEIGANYTDRKKTYVPDEYLLKLTALENDPSITTGVPIPTDVQEGIQKLGYLGIPGIIAYDPFKLLGTGVYDLTRNESTDVTAKSWLVREKVLTGWLRANIDQPTGAGSLTGNIGVQVVYTDQSSTGDQGIAGATGGVVSVTDGKKYVEILPSMNLAMRFDSHNVLRIGVARELARARMDQMKASFNVTQNLSQAPNTDPSHSYFSANGGTPTLKPWIADAADLSLEHYFGKGAYVAAAGYYKYLETYIYDQNTLFDFTGYPAQAGVTPGTNLGIFTRPQNGDGGSLYGFELSGTLPFGAFVPALDGFGAILSYSYTKSSIKPDPTDPSRPLDGLSKNVTNATLFFEKYGLSARVSMSKRSKYLAEVTGFGVSRVNREAAGETIFDAQLGYDFQSGALKGLGILVQAQDFTNERFTTYDSVSPTHIIDYQKYGVRYLAGVSYKF
jgi:iron complex outermembrane receptor protein